MEAKLENDLSLTLPFIFDDHVSQHNVEANNDQSKASTTTSFVKTCFNGLNALSGVGLVSVPYAISSGGWLSLILLFSIAITAFYTCELIKRCMDFDTNIKTYPDIGDRAFGTKGRVLASILINLELYLIATGILILEGDNLHNLFPGDVLDLAGLVIDRKQGFVLMVALVILPSVLLDNMSLLSYVSAGGFISSILILGSIIWTGRFDESIGFHQKGSVINWSGIPTSINLFTFCYCAHPVIPTVYISTRNKKRFSSVLLTCFIICTLSYASMGVFGYLMFGSETKSQITLNLPTEKLSSKVAIYTTLITPIAKYALLVTPIVDAIKTCLPNHLVNNRMSGMIIGSTILATSVMAALNMPFFTSLMSLVGAFLSVASSIIFPCLCYLKLSSIYNERVVGREMLTLLAIVIIGVGVAVTGTYISFFEIIGNV